MNMFIFLAPFGAFATLMLVAPAAVSLFAAAVVALAVIAYDIVGGRSIKFLTVGAAILFGAIGSYITLVDGSWGTVAVRLAVDAGVLAIALLSIAIRLPFTVQYAREIVDAETMRRPAFLRTNYILTWVWSAAFVLMLAVDLVAIYLPSLPLWGCAAIAFAARNSAMYFTRWYPKHLRAAGPATQPAAAAS